MFISISTQYVFPVHHFDEYIFKSWGQCSTDLWLGGASSSTEAVVIVVMEEYCSDTCVLQIKEWGDKRKVEKK